MSTVREGWLTVNSYDMVNTMLAAHFRWRRPSTGEAEFVDTDAGPGLVWPAESDEYAPLDPRRSPALLTTLLTRVDIDDRASLLRFAGSWGRLGTYDAGLESEGGPPPRAPDGRTAETLEAWAGAISALQLAAWLFAALQRRDADAVALYLINLRGEAPRRALDVRPTRVRAVAADALRAEVNRRLRALTAFELVPAGHAGGRSHLTPTPRSLLGAAWLQLAADIDRNAAPAHCDHCGRWFLSRRGSRRRRGDPAFCSPSCKVQRSRKRGRARELAAEGLGPRQVARRLDVSPSFVRDALEKGGGYGSQKTRRR